MNILKVAFIIAVIAILLVLAYNKGWLGPKKEVEHCQLDTEGRHYCE